MPTRPSHLRLLAPPRGAMEASTPEPGDLALMAALLAVNLVPLVGEATHVGRWGVSTLGFASACALVAGRELWLEVREVVRHRRSAPR